MILSSTILSSTILSSTNVNSMNVNSMIVLMLRTFALITLVLALTACAAGGGRLVRPGSHNSRFQQPRRQVERPAIHSLCRWRRGTL